MDSMLRLRHPQLDGSPQGLDAIEAQHSRSDAVDTGYQGTTKIGHCSGVRDASARTQGSRQSSVCISHVWRLRDNREGRHVVLVVPGESREREVTVPEKRGVAYRRCLHIY